MGTKLVFVVAAFAYLAFIPAVWSEATSAEPDCMVQWLTNARVSRASAVAADLWLAEQDESTIPKTNPYLLAYVLSRGSSSSASVVNARALQDCMSGVGTIGSRCSSNVPCRNGGVCVRERSQGSFQCRCKHPYFGDSCEETTSFGTTTKCCKRNQELLTTILAQVKANGVKLAKNEAQIASIKTILKYDRSIIPNITGICPPDQTILGSGLYRIHLPDVQAFTAYCDMDTDGGGYLVFQRREDGTVNFYRNYADYVKGFGDERGEHWLGLELLYRLTSSRAFKLRVDLADWSGQTASASYSSFRIASGSDGYRLSVSGYSGNAGDGMASQNGQKFSARNRDQDTWHNNCATEFRGAWWYSNCHSSNLNSVYERGTVTSYANTVGWHPWKGHHYSLKTSTMKIKLVPAL